jgi:hypothetical protein
MWLPTTPVSTLCVTKGVLLPGGKVDDPTFRAVAIGTAGDAVDLDFIYDGRSADTRALASGQLRQQIGLKLRAANGCNLIYVMWRLDRRQQLDVSAKINPGSRTHAQCGASGYTKLSPSYRTAVPALVAGARHLMQAQIAGDELFAWIDGQLAWRSGLPQEARYISGPSGIRSDNLAYRIIAMRAAVGQTGAAVPKCVTDGED